LTPHTLELAETALLEQQEHELSQAALRQILQQTQE
jgi:hypothetical protein